MEDVKAENGSAIGCGVAGVVLAAGLSSRMRGMNKLLVPLGGAPAIVRVCSAALESDLSPVIVVLGHEGDAVRDAAVRGCSAGARKLHFAFNPHFREGRLTSVAAGLAAVPAGCTAAMFIRGDQPWVSSDLIARVLHAFRAGNAPLAFPVHRGRKGSPTVYARSCFHRLLALTADGGTLELAEELWDAAARLEVDDPRCTSGIDTPEDLREFLAGHEGFKGAGEGGR